MKRTRKWAFVAQEATRLAALGLSPLEIAKRLDVNKSTVTRWMAAGKLARAAATKTSADASAVVRRPGQTPAEWAQAVRQDYDLDATDEQLVTLAEGALTLSRDLKVAAHVRMTAAGRFQALVRQLALVARNAAPIVETKPAASPPTPAPRMIRRPAADPRRLLLAVK